MALTLAQARTLLAGRTGGIQALCNNALADEGHEVAVNPDLAIAYGVVQAGGTVADLTAPTDADLATIPPRREYRALDFAEVRNREDFLGNFILVTETLGEDSRDWSDLIEGQERTIARQQALNAKQYGHGVGTPSAGSIRVGWRPRCDADG